MESLTDVGDGLIPIRPSQVKMFRIWGGREPS